MIPASMSQNAIPRIEIKSVQQLLAPSDEPEPGWLIDGLIREKAIQTIAL